MAFTIYSWLWSPWRYPDLIGRQLFIKDSLVDFHKYSTLKESHSHGFPTELMSKLRHSSVSWVVAALLRRSRTLSWVPPLSWYQLDWCLQFRPRKPKYTIQKRMICWFSHFCSVSLFRIWRKDKWHLEKLMIMASIQEDDIWWWRWWSEKKLEN